MDENVLIIADGNRKIGFGHISRCLILANEFKSNNYNVFFINKKDTVFSGLINKQFPVYKVDGYAQENATRISNIIYKNNISIVIIDLIESEYLNLEWLRVKIKDIKVATITLFLFDIKNRYEHLSFFPDLLTKVEEKKTGKYGSFQFYSGPDYFLFRDEFKDLFKIIRKNATDVLISMGGSDPKNITLKTVHALQRLSGISVKVVLSSVSNCYELVKKITDSTSHFELISGTSNMADLMIEADLAIINGGSTRYEICLARTPFIAISIHEKQFNITKNLTDLGVGINLGVYKDIHIQSISSTVKRLLKDYPMRKDMSDKMKGLFDTDGAKRIYNKINYHFR